MAGAVETMQSATVMDLVWKRPRAPVAVAPAPRPVLPGPGARPVLPGPGPIGVANTGIRVQVTTCTPLPLGSLLWHSDEKSLVPGDHGIVDRVQAGRARI
jgi:hypothetical protein